MQPHRKQWASLFRSAAPGSAAVLPGFVGEDRQHSWNGLYDSIREAQTAGLAGEAMWGSDIGGYQGGGNVTPELLGRWAQFAALTPIFEVGGAGANATFWQLGSAAVARFRAAATLHYELVPYLFDLAQRATATGLSPVRPLGLSWPGDARAWAHDAEFTVGDSLLAAPIITPAPDGRRNDHARCICRPATGSISSPAAASQAGVRSRGRRRPWTFRSTSAPGRRWRRIFVHRPCGPIPGGVNDLIRPGRQGWMVAPSVGEVSRAATEGSTLTAVEPKAGRIGITLQKPAREEQLLVLTPSRICTVRVNGAVVAHYGSASEVQSKRTGWLVEPAPRHGVLVKARGGRTITVDLSACVRLAPDADR